MQNQRVWTNVALPCQQGEHPDLFCPRSHLHQNYIIRLIILSCITTRVFLSNLIIIYSYETSHIVSIGPCHVFFLQHNKKKCKLRFIMLVGMVEVKRYFYPLLPCCCHFKFKILFKIKTRNTATTTIKLNFTYFIKI